MEINEPTTRPSEESEKLKNNSDLPKQYNCVECGGLAGHRTKDHGKNGGARAGAGRKAGGANQVTLERSAIKQAVIDRIHMNAHKLVNAQMNKAIGETYLMCQRTIGEGSKQRRETTIVTNPEVIKEWLDDTLDYDKNTEYYYMTTKPADNYALQGLLDRAFGKADSKVENTGQQKLIIEKRNYSGRADS